MKSKIKYMVIIILIIAIGIMTFLLIKEKNKEVEIKYDFNISKDTIREEITNEILYGKEKYVTHTEDGTRVNTSEKIKEAKRIKGATDLEVEGLEISTKERNTVIEATVKNKTNEKQGDFLAKLSVKDEDGREIIEVGVYVNEIEAQGETKIVTTTSTDFANAYSYEITKEGAE